MIVVSATEFKTNLGHYLDIVKNEDIVITRNGKRIAKLSDVATNKTDILNSLTGILPSDVSLNDARGERLSKYENRD